MQSKLIVTLKDGQTIESESLEHSVNISGDLVIGEEKIPAKLWKSVHVEEVKKAATKKTTKKPAKEKTVES